MSSTKACRYASFIHEAVTWQGAESASSSAVYNYGLRAVARETLPAHTRVLSLRFEDMLSDARALTAPLGAWLYPRLVAAGLQECARLATYMYLCLARVNEHDHFHDYATSLPCECACVLNWPEAVVVALADTALYSAREHNRTWLSGAYAVIDAALMEAARGLEYVPVDVRDLVALLLRTPDGWSYPRFQWAHCMYTSRAFPHLLSAPDAGPALDDTSGLTGVLLPCVDLLNHRPRTRVLWQRTSTGLDIVLEDGVSAGEEIVNNYGMKPNAELAMGYGFTLPSNVADVFTLRCCVTALEPMDDLPAHSPELAAKPAPYLRLSRGAHSHALHIACDLRYDVTAAEPRVVVPAGLMYAAGMAVVPLRSAWLRVDDEGCVVDCPPAPTRDDAGDPLFAAYVTGLCALRQPLERQRNAWKQRAKKVMAVGAGDALMEHARSCALDYVQGQISLIEHTMTFVCADFLTVYPGWEWKRLNDKKPPLERSAVLSYPRAVRSLDHTNFIDGIAACRDYAFLCKGLGCDPDDASPEVQRACIAWSAAHFLPMLGTEFAAGLATVPEDGEDLFTQIQSFYTMPGGGPTRTQFLATLAYTDTHLLASWHPRSGVAIMALPLPDALSKVDDDDTSTTSPEPEAPEPSPATAPRGYWVAIYERVISDRCGKSYIAERPTLLRLCTSNHEYGAPVAVHHFARRFAWPQVKVKMGGKEQSCCLTAFTTATNFGYDDGWTIVK